MDSEDGRRARAEARGKRAVLLKGTLQEDGAGKAGAFYSKLFGWTTDEMNMGDFTYTVSMKDGQGVGGMMKLPPGMDGVPPHWLSYVAVPDCDKATQARELGAKVCAEPQDIPNVGRFSVIQDPTGAVRASAPRRRGRPRAGT